MQRIETRRAFYAGAIALFGSIMRGLSPGEEPAESDMQMMDDITREFHEYRDGLAAEVAAKNPSRGKS